MQAGFRLVDGHRLDVRSDLRRRGVILEFISPKGDVVSTAALTRSETRALSSALMGAAAEAEPTR